MTTTRLRRLVALALVIVAIYFVPLAIMLLTAFPGPAGARFLRNLQTLAVVIAAVVTILKDRRESS